MKLPVRYGGETSESPVIWRGDFQISRWLSAPHTAFITRAEIAEPAEVPQ